LARASCQRYEVQFLDQTVALRSRALHRIDGRVRLGHHYSFEFALDGVDRRAGTIEFVAGDVKEVELDLVVDENGG